MLSCFLPLKYIPWWDKLNLLFFFLVFYTFLNMASSTLDLSFLRAGPISSLCTTLFQVLHKCFQISEWMNDQISQLFIPSVKLRKLNWLIILLIICLQWSVQYIYFYHRNTSWTTSHATQRMHLPSYLSTQHNSRECHLIPFLIKTISFSLWSLIICQSTILTYQVLMIWSPQKRNSRRDVGVNLVQRSGMYNVIIVISVIFRDSWSSALKKSVN